VPNAVIFGQSVNGVAVCHRVAIVSRSLTRAAHRATTCRRSPIAPKKTRASEEEVGVIDVPPALCASGRTKRLAHAVCGVATPSPAPLWRFPTNVGRLQTSPHPSFRSAGDSCPAQLAERRPLVHGNVIGPVTLDDVLRLFFGRSNDISFEPSGRGEFFLDDTPHAPGL
jgi:hypothetical protein